MAGKLLRDQLAKDQEPALGLLSGSDFALSVDNGKTPGWIFSTNPGIGDQIGSLCDYISTHPDRFPHPVLSFVISNGNEWMGAMLNVAQAYCARAGIGYAGVADIVYDNNGSPVPSIQAQVERLVGTGGHN